MRRVYDYEKLFDGREHRMRRDRDFVISPQSLQVIILKQAGRKGVKVTTRVWNGDVLVQAVS